MSSSLVLNVSAEEGGVPAQLMAALQTTDNSPHRCYDRELSLSSWEATLWHRTCGASNRYREIGRERKPSVWTGIFCRNVIYLRAAYLCRIISNHPFRAHSDGADNSTLRQRTHARTHAQEPVIINSVYSLCKIVWGTYLCGLTAKT